MEESKKPATPGQTKELYKLAFDAVPTEVLYTDAENMLTNPKLLQNLKEVYNSFISGEQCTKQASRILKLISQGKDLTINAVDGKATIAKAKDTFKSFIDSDFKSWGTNETSEATPETPVEVYEMMKDAKFAQMFGSLGSDLDKLCLTQSQIINFCMKYPTWLRQDGYGTFFLFKVNEQFFVAFVNVYSDGLCVICDRLDYDDVWDGSDAHRVVVPQLTV